MGVGQALFLIALTLGAVYLIDALTLGLFDRLLKSRLRLVEAVCIDAFRKELSPDLRGILDIQLRQFWSQRYPGGKKVTFIYWSKKRERSVPRFANRARDLVVATVVLASTDGSLRRAECDIVFDEGVIRVLEFTRLPKVKKRAALSVEKVILHEDPSRAVSEKSEPVAGSSISGECVRRLQNALRIEEIKPPASAEVISAFAKRARTALPADYVDLLSETDGFKTQGWEFYGTHAWRILEPDANYLVVAESPEEELAVCFREEQTQPEVLTYNRLTNEAISKGAEFVEVLIRVVSEGKVGEHG